MLRHYRFLTASLAVLALVAAGWFWLVRTPGPSEPAGPATDPGPLRLVVDISERQLYINHGGQVEATHPVAVGQSQYPTPTGSFTIHQIDWNPDWTPPESDWAAGETYKAPGEPGNPMGRVRMVFSAPYTIHGTDALGSLGRAASHGSIRLANQVAIRVARQVMVHGGASRSQSWFDETLGNPNRMRTVRLPNPVPLRVRP